MSKSTKTKILLILVILTITSIGYSADLHFGLELGGVGNAGFSHSKASHQFRYCEEGSCYDYDTDADGYTH